MTLVTKDLKDVNSVPDNTRFVFRTVLRESEDGQSMVSPRIVRKSPEHGVISVNLEPGPVEVGYYGTAHIIDVPDSDDPVDLWQLIQEGTVVNGGQELKSNAVALRGLRTWAIPVDPGSLDTLYQYVDENGDEVGTPIPLSHIVSVGWDGIYEKPPVIAAGADASAARAEIGATSADDVNAAAAAAVAGSSAVIDAAAAAAAANVGVLTASKPPALDRNYVPNPQGKGGPVNNSDSTSFTLSESTTGLPTGASYGLQSVRKGTNNGTIAILNFGSIATANANMIPVTAGTMVSALVDGVWSDDPATKTSYCYLTFYNASDASVSTVNGTASALASSTYESRKIENVLVPVGATHVLVRVLVSTTGTSSTGSVTKATKAKLVAGATVGAYGDGATALWAWSGTAHASQSVQLFRSKADQDAMYAEVGAAAAVKSALYTSVSSGKNLYNPADVNVATDKYITSSGALDVISNYRVTGYIPVTVDAVISAAPHLHAAFYTSGLVKVGSVLNAGGATATYTVPATAAFARFDFQYVTNPNFQVEVGTGTAYEAYYEYLVPTPRLQKTIGLLAAPAATAVSVIKSGNALSITSGLFTNNVNLAGSNNGGFTFSSTYLGQTQVASTSDDVCPIITQLGYVGANHGYRDPLAGFTNPDGKTTADIGSVWQDTAGREYVLLGFYSGKLLMGGSYTGGTSTPVLVEAVNPTTNLTHVSGAIHTGAIDYTTRDVGKQIQLYPSLGRITVTAWLDGFPLSADGTYAGAALEIRESYEILDYKALYDYAKANPGGAYATSAIAGCVLVQNVFRYNGSGRCLVSTTYDELKPTTLANCGSVQAQNLTATGKALKRYVPGMNIVGGFAWSTGVDMTSYSTDLFLPASSANVAGRIPAFHLDTLDVSGTLFCGFACGYLPFKPSDNAGRSSQRSAKAPNRLWLFSDGKKVYPYFTEGEAAGWGHIQVYAFRVYLSPAQLTSILAAKTDALVAFAAFNAAAKVE